VVPFIHDGDPITIILVFNIPGLQPGIVPVRSLARESSAIHYVVLRYANSL
jgi:hypothetical protein